VSAGDLLRRLERNTVVVVAMAALALILYRPGQPGLALGVVGGGVLVGLAYWSIRGAVDALTDRAIQGENARQSRGLGLVKFFTRHAILALAGYGMMTRLDLHPIGLLIGVSAPAAAAAIEAMRPARGSDRS
jgi:ATP synthase I chain